MSTENTSQIAIIVASGGLDSCVAAKMASETFKPAMMHVQYGQRTAKRELKAFHDISKAINAYAKMVVNMDYLGHVGGSSLTDKTIRVPVVTESGIPSTYVPFRNANLFSAAVSWAEAIGAGIIYTGINQVDSSGYPDCTEHFLSAYNQVIFAGTRPETQIQLIAPLLGMSKKEIVQCGLELNAPFHLSWSCYQNTMTACGVCDSCRLRIDAFKRNNAIDPLPYVGNPFGR
jgi:7-cyano-7-deazaguanine synthase